MILHWRIDYIYIFESLVEYTNNNKKIIPNSTWY